MFEETRDKGVANGVFYTCEVENLAECQEVCGSEHPDCYAADYKDGLCSLVDKYGYRYDKLIKNVGNVHFVFKPCDGP